MRGVLFSFVGHAVFVILVFVFSASLVWSLLCATIGFLLLPVMVLVRLFEKSNHAVHFRRFFAGNWRRLFRRNSGGAASRPNSCLLGVNWLPLL